MGDEYTVSVWEFNTNQDGYLYREVYRGDDWQQVLRAMLKGKNEGYGCIKVEWRPMC